MGWLDPRLGECWSDIYIVPFYSWVIYALQSPTKKDSILLVICLCRIYAVFMVVYYWSALIITLCRMTYLLPGCFHLFYFFPPKWCTVVLYCVAGPRPASLALCPCGKPRLLIIFIVDSSADSRSSPATDTLHTRTHSENIDVLLYLFIHLI